MCTKIAVWAAAFSTIIKLNNNEEGVKEKLETYTYCNYCGEKVETENKYHHACLMKKYKGELIKND